LILACARVLLASQDGQWHQPGRSDPGTSLRLRDDPRRPSRASYGARRQRTRAPALAQLFTAARLGVGVAGTSGKSTTVGMNRVEFLHAAGRSPTIMNGADMEDFMDVDSPIASARVATATFSSVK